jgi:hypothetical protein
VRKTLFASLWLTISLISFGQFFEEDSLFMPVPKHGEVYLKTGYGQVVRTNSAFYGSGLILGLGLEVLPGKWSIGSEIDFLYRYRSPKFFSNLKLPTARLFAGYEVFQRDVHKLYAGISAGMITGIYTQYQIEGATLSYAKQIDHQNAIIVGLRANYKFIQPIGKQSKSNVNSGFYTEVSLPVLAFNQSNPRGEQQIPYSSWLYRLGLNFGVRIGFGG